jgi:Flp pilus assembly protein TadG
VIEELSFNGADMNRAKPDAMGTSRFRGLLSELKSNATGNTFAIMAAALVPLTAMIGGGIEASRAYMAKTRLQQACDAGALAGRKVMAASSWSASGAASSNQQAQNFFKANYADGLFGANSVTASFSPSSEGQVDGVASAVLPMMVMKMFGFQPLTLNVECKAELNLSNTDVMFVLDTTGSMNEVNTGDSSSKIVGLRGAVMDFYDELAKSVPSTVQLRYGFVPYSMNVNVGKLLYAENSNWIVNDTWTYQSRVWGNTQDVPVAWGAATATDWSTNTTKYYTQQNNWTDVAANVIGSTPNPDSSKTTQNGCQNATVDVTLVLTNYQPDSVTNGASNIDNTSGIKTTNVTKNQYISTTEYRRRWEKRGSDSSNKCYVESRGVQYTLTTTGSFTQPATQWQTVSTTNGNQWTYKPITYDVSNFVAGSSVTTQTGNSGANVSSTWNGCIEERDTVATDNFNPIPIGAKDLDINMVPQDKSTKWRPAWPKVEYLRYSPQLDYVTQSEADTDSNYKNPSAVCPVEAKRLAVFDRASVQAYVNTLTPSGTTYHDIGMLWGARFISPSGIFAATNNSAPNGQPISRHLIFMTDGLLNTGEKDYTAYGIEKLDQRMTGGSGTGVQWTRTNERFMAICRAARNANISVWAVGFGTSVPDSMYTCAGDDPANKTAATHTFQADNTAQLKEQFKNIAAKIASLRIGK